MSTSNGSKVTANLPVFLSSDGRKSAEVLRLLPREESRSKSKGAIADTKRFRDPRLIYELSGILWEDRTTHTVHLTKLGKTCAQWVGKLTLENHTLMARHAVPALAAMELRNPTEEGGNYRSNMEVFPALFVWEAMLDLDGRISSEEMNRAIMNTTNHDDLLDAIKRIKLARSTSDSRALGPVVVPKGRAQNDRIIPWMSLISFGWLLLKDKRESASRYYELRPECIPMLQYACGLPRKFQNYADIASYARHLSDQAFREFRPDRKPAPHFVAKPHYASFGEAPDDDLTALQNFARAVRKGQPKFRKKLLELYDGKCAITGWAPKDVLEAAHIEPHSKSGINKSVNGLLLRSDLHNLMDTGLVKIAADCSTVIVDERLKATPYWEFNGKKLRPRRDGSKIGQEYILLRWPAFNQKITQG